MEEKEIKDKELMEIKNERWGKNQVERSKIRGNKDSGVSSQERERKRQQVLSSLQTFDQSTDPEAYLSSFELFMREGGIPESTDPEAHLSSFELFPEGEWPAILRKQASGRVMEVMMYLDLTIPYQSIKSNLLEYLDTPMQEPGRRRGLKTKGITNHHEVFWHP